MKYKYLKDLAESFKNRNKELIALLKVKEKRIDDLTVLNMQLLSDIEILKIKR